MVRRHRLELCALADITFLALHGNLGENGKLQGAFDVLGIRDESAGGDSVNLEPYRKAVDLLLEMRRTAKSNKDWATSDLIRDKLSEFGFEVKDTKDGFEWKVK